MKWKLSLRSGGDGYSRSWVCHGVLEAGSRYHSMHAADDRYVSLQRQLGATQPRARRPGRHEKRGVESRRRGGGASLMVPQKSITRAVLAWREKERPYAAHYSRVSQEQTCAGPERLRRDPSPAAAPPTPVTSCAPSYSPLACAVSTLCPPRFARQETSCRDRPALPSCLLLSAPRSGSKPKPPSPTRLTLSRHPPRGRPQRPNHPTAPPLPQRRSRSSHLPSRALHPCRTSPPPRALPALPRPTDHATTRARVGPAFHFPRAHLARGTPCSSRSPSRLDQNRRCPRRVTPHIFPLLQMRVAPHRHRPPRVRP